MTIRIAVSALLLSLAACSTAPQAASAAASGAATAALVPLTVQTAAGPRRFRVAVARTAEEQARGLMFRETMPADEGMIFPMDPPRPASFWMKNTILPLDMIFIRADGTIARVAERTVPYSLDTVDSGEPVAAVLELNGGAAAAAGMAPGDTVKWPG